jgi:hypothetical protein
MAALAMESRSANGNGYRSLRADFDVAYKEMTEASREFNAVLMNVPAGLSPEDQRARKEHAARVYEDAHARFMATVRKLNDYMIRQIVSSRSTIQQVTIHR